MGVFLGWMPDAATQAALMEPILPGEVYMKVKHAGWKYKEDQPEG